MSQSNRPVPDPVETVWTEPSTLDDYCSTETLPGHCDILIVGSGFSGVATAYHLLKDITSAGSVVIVDARKHCFGATARNGGHVKPDTYYNVSKYERLYGAKEAAALAKLEISGVHATKTLVESENLECDFHLTRAVDVYMDAQHAQDTINAYQRLVQRGDVDLRDVAYTSKADAERVSGIYHFDQTKTNEVQVSGVKGAQCCFSFTAAHLWPRKLVLQLFAKLLRRGLQAYANTPVLQLSPEKDANGNWTVRTSKGEIKARKVVFCMNGYSASVLPQYTNKIVPVRGVCSHIVSPKGSQTPHLPNTYSLRFGGANYDYLIPRADGSIVVGGARQTFLHRKNEWFGSVSDNEQPWDNSVEYFDGYMQRHFRGWEDSGAVTRRVWTGSEFQALLFG